MDTSICIFILYAFPPLNFHVSSLDIQPPHTIQSRLMIFGHKKASWTQAKIPTGSPAASSQFQNKAFMMEPNDFNLF